MVLQMIALRLRCVLGVSLLTALAAATAWLAWRWAGQLRRPETATGLILMALIVFLTLFNARKKLPFLPLLSASVWMQLHVYAGGFSVVLFFAHAGFNPPRGGLELTLAVLFLVVTGSGVFGLLVSRWIPPRLTLHGEPVIYERIPVLRTRLRQEVEELVVGAVAAAHSSTIGDFYERRLRAYFERPRHLWWHLIGYQRPLQDLLAEVKALDRYLSQEERKLMNSLAECLRAKHNLDFQLAGQALLKWWLFVHIPLSYALILMALLHGLVAWAFA